MAVAASGIVYTCSKCVAAFQITSVGPANAVGSPQFCPRCGNPFGNASVIPYKDGTFPQEQLWEEFATRYNLGPGTDLVRRVWSLWDAKKESTPTFESHLQELMREE